MLKHLYSNFENINISFSVQKELVVPSQECFGDSFLPVKDSVFQSKYITDFAAQTQRNAEVGAALLHSYCFLWDRSELPQKRCREGNFNLIKRAKCFVTFETALQQCNRLTSEHQTQQR